MSRYTLYIMLIAVFVLGAAMPAFSQSVPSVKGLKAFAAETNYMSLPGFLRSMSQKKLKLFSSDSLTE